MIVHEGTNSARIVRALQAATRPLTSRELADQAGIPQTAILFGTRWLLECNYVLKGFRESDRKNVWTIGMVPCAIQPERRKKVDRRSPDEITRAKHREPLPEAILITRLRDLFFQGQSVATGDPLMLLAECLSVAQRVLQSKDEARFPGAEVERFVGREVRSISLAILNTTNNMRSALESTIAAEPPPRSQPCRVPSTSSTSTSSSTTSPLPSGAGCVTA